MLDRNNYTVEHLPPKANGQGGPKASAETAEPIRLNTISLQEFTRLNLPKREHVLAPILPDRMFVAGGGGSSPLWDERGLFRMGRRRASRTRDEPCRREAECLSVWIPPS